MSIVLAKNDIEKCISVNNITCESCVHVNITIISGEETREFFVGDYFYYNITILNIGNKTINSQLRVDVYNPQRELIGTSITFPINLEPNETTFLFPNMTEDLKKYYIFIFDSIGSYKINISSDDYLHFYHFYPKRTSCKYVRHFWSYLKYFDAMPRWDYEWKKEMRVQIEKYEKVIQELRNETKGMKDATKEMLDISKEMKISSKLMRELSILVLVLTIANVTCTILRFLYVEKLSKKDFLLTFILIVLICLLILLII